MLPCLIFEDDHLLVVNKPAGINTHAPSPFAAEGIYDWLRHREPRWSKLAIIHRLDKETSGLLLFSKTPVANRSLTAQFAERKVRKKYLFLTDRVVPGKPLVVKSTLVRDGERYVSRPAQIGLLAETRFHFPHSSGKANGFSQPVNAGEAEPLTGRTHQIRVQASQSGFPILGDELYGGTPAPRVFLHATELAIQHPASHKPLIFRAPPDFEGYPLWQLRAALIDPGQTDAWRLCHGASDGWPGWYVDRFGDFLLCQSETTPGPAQLEMLTPFVQATKARGVSYKAWARQLRPKTAVEVSPRPLIGEPPPEQFRILENGVRFVISFAEGYSVGLFLDQRENRRRILANYVAADFHLFEADHSGSARTVLNTFAYTCGFSVCAAKTGAHTTSLDLSKKYLDWGKRNFEANGLSTDQHDFIFGDVFDWLRRLARKQRVYDLVLLDPPTFSQSKESGVFRVEKDYGKLVALVLPLLKPGAVLFASTNYVEWEAANFLSTVEKAIDLGHRKILQSHYVPQPPDFRPSRREPLYLKTVWMRIG